MFENTKIPPERWEKTARPQPGDGGQEVQGGDAGGLPRDTPREGVPSVTPQEPATPPPGGVRRIPLVGALGRFAKGLLTVGRMRTRVHDLSVSTTQLHEAIQNLQNAMIRDGQQLRQQLSEHGYVLSERLDEQTNTLTAQLRDQEDGLTKRLEEGEARDDKLERVLEGRIATTETRLAAMRRQMAALASARTRAPRPNEQGDEVLPVEISEAIYVALENAYRGDPEDITNRQRVYLPDIREALARAAAGEGGAGEGSGDPAPVLDLGCGRGEFLGLLRDEGIRGLGVDTNAGQLHEARERGLAVTQEDGLHYLKAQPDGSLAVVSGFHIAEHLPFEVLCAWMVEALRALKPGGLLLLETPNPDNLIVGANTFHRDPTHNKPLPKELLALVADALGYTDIETRVLHPHERLDEAVRALPGELPYLLFGYQDYALLAQKPSEAPAKSTAAAEGDA